MSISTKWAITIAIIALNVWLWWKGKLSLTKRLFTGAASLAALWLMNSQN